MGRNAWRRRVAVKDELVRAAEDAFHRLQIDAFAGDILGLVIFLIDLEETRALASCFGNRLLLVAFGGLDDLRRAPARIRNDPVGISLRLVLQPLEIGARRPPAPEPNEPLAWR